MYIWKNISKIVGCCVLCFGKGAWIIRHDLRHASFTHVLRCLFYFVRMTLAYYGTGQPWPSLRQGRGWCDSGSLRSINLPLQVLRRIGSVDHVGVPVGLKAHFVQSVSDLSTCQDGPVATVEVHAHRHFQQLWQNWITRKEEVRKATREVRATKQQKRSPNWKLSWATGKVTLFTCGCHIIRRLRRQVVECFSGELSDRAAKQQKPE